MFPLAEWPREHAQHLRRAGGLALLPVRPSSPFPWKWGGKGKGLGNAPVLLLLEAGLWLVSASSGQRPVTAARKARMSPRNPYGSPGRAGAATLAAPIGWRGTSWPPASRSAQDAPSQDMPLLTPGAPRQLMLLFLILIPLLGTGPGIALVCITTARPSQLGVRSLGWRLPD